jgi:carboxymethylenebutenolidase
MINFDSGDERYEGYLAVANKGRGPGVIVIQEYWGLVDHIKNVADRFAAEGFTALAPDLYRGKQTTDPGEAEKLMMALDIDHVAEVLARGAQWLAEHEAVSSTHVGVVGFCMGGQLALFGACLSDHIGACVDFYGIHPKVECNLRELNAPVLGIFAERDHFATPEAVKHLDQELTKLKKPHEFITYPGTDHAFLNDSRPEVYNPQAAADAWKRTIEFLRKHLPETKA